ncbi:hypothetical protein E2C01_044074 [Portunus trituberculatus]|uniref:Uncharacterized protein n=1 Tax=Portunus trituberculatus TaxID=210409 RepID=A0A5B7FR39_PORTR|nr:hypothetical protein [Portunus trituberculatus]
MTSITTTTTTRAEVSIVRTDLAERLVPFSLLIHGGSMSIWGQPVQGVLAMLSPLSLTAQPPATGSPRSPPSAGPGTAATTTPAAGITGGGSCGESGKLGKTTAKKI